MFEWIQSVTGNPILDGIMEVAAVYLIYVIPLALIGLWLARWKRPAVVLFLATLLAIIASYGLGELYAHDPPHLQGYEVLLENEPENAFPSNHAAAIFGFAFGAIYTGFRRFSAIALLVAVLLGVARIYTGLHFPIDIAGGVLAGAIGVLVVSLARSYVDRVADIAVSLEDWLLELVDN